MTIGAEQRTPSRSPNPASCTRTSRSTRQISGARLRAYGMSRKCFLEKWGFPGVVSSDTQVINLLVKSLEELTPVESLRPSYPSDCTNVESHRRTVCTTRPPGRPQPSRLSRPSRRLWPSRRLRACKWPQMSRRPDSCGCQSLHRSRYLSEAHAPTNHPTCVNSMSEPMKLSFST